MLAALLQDETAALGELRNCLRQEYDALKTRDLVALQLITDSKRACAGRLEALAERRRDHLAASGFGPEPDATRVFIEASPASERERLCVLWETWMDSAIKARRQNSINGGIIAASREQVERALTIVRGADPSNRLYDQNAHTTYDGNRRSIAKA